MATYPRYLSFSPGELEARLRELGNNSPHHAFVGLAPHANSRAGNGAPRKGRLLKSHSCPVTFPDGRSGCCHYLRGGPAWHIFRYDYDDGGTRLPAQHETRRLENDVASIERVARERASSAFAEAILRERKEYFQRASESAERQKHPERFQMKPLRAKALAGKYAVCHRIGQRLLPLGKAHVRLEDANREWQVDRASNPLLVVACCNRLDRCWELPQFNPLYATLDARLKTPAKSVSVANTVPAEDWDYLPGPDDCKCEEDEDA